MFRKDQARITFKGRRAGSALRVHEALKARPITSLPETRRTTGLSFPAVSSAMDLLVGMKIARELTGERRNRLFAYDRYLTILSEGTEADRSRRPVRRLRGTKRALRQARDSSSCALVGAASALRRGVAEHFFRSGNVQ